MVAQWQTTDFIPVDFKCCTSLLKVCLKYTTNSETISTGCEALNIYTSPSELTLNVNESGDVVVTVTGGNVCPVRGDTVTASVNSTGKNVISVSPTSAVTNTDGEATFTITAKNKAGNATVTFKDSRLKTKVKVKVVK